MILEKIKCIRDGILSLTAALSKETGRVDAVICNFLKTLCFNFAQTEFERKKAFQNYFVQIFFDDSQK